ncbi:hypothetical protein TNCV_232141 [Trichonephila clavipes]|nr:hypothetical protein TNCV_232141 [Trichonephila clavipes]
MYSSAEYIPKTFNWIKIRRVSQSLSTHNPSLSSKSSTMAVLWERASSSNKTNEAPIAAEYSFTMKSRTSSRYRTYVTDPLL